MPPTLEALRLAPSAEGERAGQMLLARLGGKDPGAPRVDIGFEVVGRGSA